MRRAAGAGAATGALDSCSAGGFTVAAFVDAGAAGFEARGDSLRGGCTVDFGSEAGCEAAEVVEEEEFGRWLRIFGRAKMAKVMKNAAKRGTT